MPDLPQLIAQWGYPAIVLILVLGNMGVPVPEETALIVAGYLVWQGHLRLPIVFVVSVVSAVAGDNVGYWLGRRYGQTAVERVARWAAVDTERINAMRRFVARHGALAVFVGRFIPGLRFLAGPLTGASGLDFRAFFLANVFGAAVFVPYAVGLGYAIGYGLGPYIAEIQLAERAVLIGAILCVVAYAGWRIVQSRRRRGGSSD